MQLTTNFTLEEMVLSQTAIRQGIDNTPDAGTIENLRQLCVNVLEPFRALIGQPIHVDSGYRSVALNAAIGGVSTSQHCKGQAADIVVSGMTVDLLVAIARDLPQYDQLIHEFDSWMHISYNPFNVQRKEVLKATKVNGKTVYTPFPKVTP